jgi:uncharacterized protein (TIGR02679 family)
VDVDRERLERTLGGPHLARLVARIVRRMERDGSLGARVVLGHATHDEQVAAARLLGRRPSHAASIAVPLAKLEAILRNAGIAPTLRAAIETLAAPVEPRTIALDRESRARAAVRSDTEMCRYAGEPWYRRWVDELGSDGTLTRLLRRGEAHLVQHAARVLAELPGPLCAAGAAEPELPLPVLAERATGDTKALAGTPLAALVLRALSLCFCVPRPTSAGDRQALWERAGVIAGDLASQVLVLHLRATPEPGARGGKSPAVLASWLEDAAAHSVPLRLTLHQLVAMPIVPTAAHLYVCENPAVLRAAAEQTGAALVCTEGQPSLAAHRLLRAAVSAGATLYWRNDFDWDGLRMTEAARARYGALPWRMAATDYLAAIESGDSEPLKGAAAPSPWDARLSAEMQQTGRAIMEERLIAELMEDLRRASCNSDY